MKRQSPRKDLVDVNVNVREVIDLAADQIRRNHIALRTDLADALPRVEGDPVQLQQVLLNLLTNAIDAMAAVRDRPHMLCVRSEHLEDWVLVSVQDSGTGIAPEHPERMFDAFFTTKPNGIGLALSIAAR